MPPASRHLCRHLLRIRPAQQRCRVQRQSLRSFTSTTRRLEDEQFDITKLSKPAKPLTPQDLSPNDRANYEALSKPNQEEYMAIQNHLKAMNEDPSLDLDISEDQIQSIAGQIERENMLDFTEVKNPKALRDGFWQIDEDDELGVNPDGDDELHENDITSVAESQLELHREIREYTRIAAWDLPLLLQFTKPFELPNMTATPLRFRYTTYLGEVHPAQRKVVLEFVTKEVAETAGLTEQQRSKMIKILGTRYNPDKDLVRMSCEKFENQAQNKRYLGDLVNKIVAESKTGDMFEDVPFDFRHHKPKPNYVFPEEWAVGTRGGVKRLIEKRGELKLLEGDGETIDEKPVDGGALMEQFVRAKQGTDRLIGR